MAAVQGDEKRAIELNEVSLKLCRELGLGTQLASALNSLGTIYARKGDVKRAAASFEEGIAAARQDSNIQVLCNCCYMLAGTLVDAGIELPCALALYEECLALTRQHKLRVTESMTLSALGIACAFSGDLARARLLLPEALQMQRELNTTMAIGWTLQFHGLLDYLQKEYAAAEAYLLESLEMAPRGGTPHIVSYSLEVLGGILSLRQQPTLGARLLGAAEGVREKLDHHRAPVEQPLYDGILATLRTQLPLAVLEAEWQRGRSFSVAEAIIEARTYCATDRVNPPQNPTATP
jgi:tetratricopeptide (TPR) repeat protein